MDRGMILLHNEICSIHVYWMQYTSCTYTWEIIPLNTVRSISEKKCIGLCCVAVSIQLLAFFTLISDKLTKELLQTWHQLFPCLSLLALSLSLSFIYMLCVGRQCQCQLNFPRIEGTYWKIYLQYLHCLILELISHVQSIYVFLYVNNILAIVVCAEGHNLKQYKFFRSTRKLSVVSFSLHESEDPSCTTGMQFCFCSCSQAALHHHPSDFCVTKKPFEN